MTSKAVLNSTVTFLMFSNYFTSFLFFGLTFRQLKFHLCLLWFCVISHSYIKVPLVLYFTEIIKKVLPKYNLYPVVNLQNQLFSWGLSTKSLSLFWAVKSFRKASCWLFSICSSWREKWSLLASRLHVNRVGGCSPGSLLSICLLLKIFCQTLSSRSFCLFDFKLTLPDCVCVCVCVRAVVSDSLRL